MLLLHAKEGANTFALLEGPHREHKVEVGHSTFFISPWTWNFSQGALRICLLFNEILNKAV
jgi:hypothetical protein